MRRRRRRRRGGLGAVRPLSGPDHPRLWAPRRPLGAAPVPGGRYHRHLNHLHRRGGRRSEGHRGRLCARLDAAAFGAAQVLLSQLPEYTHLGWVSAFGALMSIGYCAIATGLAAAYRVQGGGPAASYVSSTLTEPSPVKRVINIFAAMSTVLFAYGGHNIALEIQATLPRPPTVQRMMRGVNIAFVITGVLYFSVAISGYAATGAATGDNIVLSLSNGPAWLRALARAMVVVHVLAAYQVYTHPVFDWVESAAGRAAARAGCAPLASAFSYGSWPSRLLLRTAHVGFTTLVAIIIPFFGELMALIGAVAITPTTYFLPPLLWLILNKPHRFGLEWWVNICLVAVTGVIGLMGTISATWLIVSHATTYQFFAQ
ncbi:lysine histidine transporter 1-like [Raphidocelis subcapitata]|uniref:Lysine histidine transporter 1-like n=1 Tax=Raphidocelis subcapitata TaxID=307507 RepID=A0A2V0P9U2_9CHLO|nr:lysine histidine transporter 1-like [Raphidocelis subcapitata]|eukprot:GBF95712.1 lysine histidine transporter 1-like [Raphidocelis subcapitata]